VAESSTKPGVEFLSKGDNWFDFFFYEQVIHPKTSGNYRELENLFAATIPQGAKVLEVGCGGGRVSCNYATRRPDVRVLAIDLSPHMIARCKKRQAEVGVKNIDFRVGSAMDLSSEAREGPYQAVLSVGSIKHWPDPAKGIAEMAKALEPGGWMYLTDANPHATPGQIRQFVELWRIPWGTTNFFAKKFKQDVVDGSCAVDDIKNWFTQNGIVDIQVDHYSHHPFVGIRGFKKKA